MTLDSRRALTVLDEHDPQFTELVTSLYGRPVAPGQLWREAFAKLSPGPSDVHVPGADSRRHRPNGLARAAAVTATGVGALLGVKELAEQTPKALKVGSAGKRMFRTRAGWIGAPTGRGRPVPAGVSRLLAATPRPLARLAASSPVPGPATRAAGTLGMFGGDILATHQLRRQDVEKSVLSELADGYAHQARQVVRRLLPARTGGVHAAAKAKPAAGQHTMFDPAGRPAAEGATVGNERLSATNLGTKTGAAWSAATATGGRKAATAAVAGTAGVAAVRHTRGGQQPTYPGPTPYYYSKRSERTPVEVEWAGTFSKLDTDKRLAFGWASVSKVNGVTVLDRQGDVLEVEDLEDAVYRYVERSRVGGDMHERQDLFGKLSPGFNSAGVRPGLGLWEQSGTDAPRKVADLVESMVFTEEKIAKLGLPESFPRGWWVGFHYHDDDVWQGFKDGSRTGFSIHGKGYRAPVDYDDVMTGVG